MYVQIYDGSSSTVLETYLDVKTASINSDGSLTLTSSVLNPAGQLLRAVEASGNKIVITRQASDT